MTAGGYHAKIRQKPKFVDEAACTGCRECEMACNVAVPDEYNADMVSRRAAFIAFPQAVPKKAVISREGVSPCTYDCPAGIKAHGYVARVRSGEYEQAFDLVLETTPLVGIARARVLRALRGRVHAWRARGPAADPPAQALHRRSALRPGGSQGRREARAERQARRRRRLGPGRPHRRLAAGAQGLRRQDLRGGAQPGGMLRLGIPAYRLPERRRRRRRRQRDGDRRRDRDRRRGSTTSRRSRTTASTPCSWRRARTRQCSCACPARSWTASSSALTFLADVKLGTSVDLAASRCSSSAAAT